VFEALRQGGYIFFYYSDASLEVNARKLKSGRT
jgi:hypothetical protein